MVIHSVVDNGPVAPAAQEGYDVTVFGSGRVEIVITPPGASEALGNQTTAEKQTRTVTLTDTELTKLLTDLQTAGYFGLTQTDRINPKAQVTGGGTSVLTVSLVDGEWKVNGNGLTQDEAATLEKAQSIVSRRRRRSPTAVAPQDQPSDHPGMGTSPIPGPGSTSQAAIWKKRS